MKSCSMTVTSCCYYRRNRRSVAVQIPANATRALVVVVVVLLLLVACCSPLLSVRAFANTAGVAMRRDLACRGATKTVAVSRSRRRALTTSTRSTALAAVPFDPSYLLSDAAAAVQTTTTLTAEALVRSSNDNHLLSSIDAIGSHLSSSVLLSSSAEAGAPSLPVLEGGDDGPTGMLSKQTAITVFIVGLVPWTVATFEFWRRIAVGASFGTSDPVVIIGEDDNPASSRGRQVLGKGALVTAYAIFTVVAVVLGLVVYSVLTTTATTAAVPPPTTAAASLTVM